MPEPLPVSGGIVNKIASRPLFRVRTFVAVVCGVGAWVAARFGVPGIDIVGWAGPDSLLTVGELVQGLALVAAGFFTVKRKPGAIAGVFKAPES